MAFLTQGMQTFFKNLKVSSKSKQMEGDMRQVQHCGLANIKHNHTQFCSHRDLAPRNLYPSIALNQGLHSMRFCKTASRKHSYSCETILYIIRME